MRLWFTIGCKRDGSEGSLQLYVLCPSEKEIDSSYLIYFRFTYLCPIDLWASSAGLEHSASAAGPASPCLMIYSTFISSHLALVCCSWWLSVVSVKTHGCHVEGLIFHNIFSLNNMGSSASTTWKTNLILVIPFIKKDPYNILLDGVAIANFWYGSIWTMTINWLTFFIKFWRVYILICW